MFGVTMPRFESSEIPIGRARKQSIAARASPIAVQRPRMALCAPTSEEWPIAQAMTPA